MRCAKQKKVERRKRCDDSCARMEWKETVSEEHGFKPNTLKEPGHEPALSPVDVPRRSRGTWEPVYGVVGGNATSTERHTFTNSISSVDMERNSQIHSPVITRQRREGCTRGREQTLVFFVSYRIYTISESKNLISAFKAQSVAGAVTLSVSKMENDCGGKTPGILACNFPVVLSAYSWCYGPHANIKRHITCT